MAQVTEPEGAAGWATRAATEIVGPAIARPRFQMGGALAVGVLVEALLHGQPLGLGWALSAAVVAGGWLALGRGVGIRPSLSALALLACLVVTGALVAWRASPALQSLNVLGGLALVLLVASLFRPGRLAGLSITEYALALVVGALAAVGQPFVFLLQDLPARREPRPAALAGLPASASGAPALGTRLAAPALRGLALAFPLLLLFGALFYSADAVFAGYVHQLLAWNIDLADLVGRVILSLMLAWFALGLARLAFTRDEDGSGLRVAARPAGLAVGEVEAVVALALIDVLFLSFVLIQAVYLFGGADTLVRSGLSHSEYARRGFFELVTTAALVLSLILLLDWLARPRQPRGRLYINLLHGLLVLLTLVILASAWQRMQLYQQEYGLTELRFYTTAFMIWLAVVLVWLPFTVLRPAAASGRRRFAFGALLAGMAMLAVLNLLNPDEFIARTNLARADLASTGLAPAAAGRVGPLDAIYLSLGLSEDAVPAVVAALPALPDRCVQAELARGLQARATALAQRSRSTDWRGANWGTFRAGQALAAADLAAYGPPCAVK